MKRWCTCIALLFLIGCGKDDGAGEDLDEADAGTDVLMVETPEPDAGTPDMTSATEMGGAENAENSVTETPRDDLETVVEDREVDFIEGASGRLAFDVPQDAVSVTVSVTGAPGQFFSLEEWKNGDGEAVVPGGWVESDAGAPTLCLSCPNRISSSEASFAAVLPNNESVEVVPGTHNITAYGFKQAGFSTTPLSGETATVRVLVKKLGDEPPDGVLDINFHFTGAKGWTAETAPDDEDFQAAIAELDSLYDQVGIDVGVVTYTDIPEEYRVIENTTLPNSDLQEMFALSEHQPRKAINIFIVEELMTGFGEGFGVVAGVSGGIPGPPMAGTHRSGVAIATKQDPELNAEFFRVMAHEVGHHLGLFHTSENALAGGVHDPIGDTPENDSSLLMFNVPEGGTITPIQGEVMRRSRWVHHGGDQ